ncbi:MAG: MBL fold metallo-hydrolase [Archaeoglobus sp.]|nr:MBL fold metallo-hydrolase [Archaeoglobus sp.]
MKILELSDELYLVDLPLPKTGFRRFISSWVFKSGNKAFLVDVGASASIEKLNEALEYLKVKKVEFVLITHIHIDHAGGLGDFLSYHPEAKVIVHEKGVKHLLNPKKLWEGSIKVLGDLALLYGEIKPVPEENFADGKLEFEGSEIRVVKTPGHAPHHQSYVYDRYLFAGEALGVHQYLKIRDFYMRPATPPKFVYEVAKESIEKLQKLGDLTVCFGHFGYEEGSSKIIENSAKQLDLWVETVEDIACEKGYQEEAEIIQHSREELIRSDPLFAKYTYLDDDIKQREDYFIENTLRGMAGYVKERFCPD